jgi:hypothetical protein
MSYSFSLLHALVVAGLVGGGVYLHKIDDGAKATLAEANRINLESRERLRRIEADTEAQAAARQKVEALATQGLQQIAEREARLNDQAITALESQARQAEQLQAMQQDMAAERQRLNQASMIQAAAAQRRYEGELNRLAAEQRQQEERLRQEDQRRTYQAVWRAVPEERGHRPIPAAIGHTTVQATPTAILWQRPLPTVVAHVEYHHTKKIFPAEAPPQPCAPRVANRPAATVPTNCR